MKPIERPSTNRPFSVPIYVRGVNAAAQGAAHAPTHLDVLICLLGRERAAVAQQIDKADSDAAVDVQDEL